MATGRSPRDDDVVDAQVRRAERLVPIRKYENITAQDGAGIHNGDRYYQFHAGSGGDPPDGEKPEDPKLKRLLNALAFAQMGFRATAVPNAYQSTCRWFFETPEYARWCDRSLRQTHHGLLWVKGKPGSGKSTITKCAVEHAKRNQVDEKIIYFFFNARGDHLEKSTEGMFRCLLHQMAQHSSWLVDFVGDKAVAAYAQQGWPPELLSGLFRQAVCQLGKKAQLYCYIDALDEGDEDEIRDLVDFLEDLLGHAVGNNIDFSVYLASRHYPNISVNHSEQFLLDRHEGHDTDISVYVSGKLRCKPATLKAELAKRILGRSSGIFLWVALVVKDLNRESDRGSHQQRLLSRLQNTPSGLKELFQRTACETDETGYMVPALQWVLFAERALEPMELYFAILTSVDPGPRISTTWNRDHVDENSAKDFIISASKGLLEVVVEDEDSALRASCWPPRKVVQFIHESVREYLLDSGLTLLDSTLGGNMVGLCNLRIAAWCEAYLESGLKHTSAHEAESDEGSLLAYGNPIMDSGLPLLRYALQEFLHHKETAARHGLSVQVRSEAFLRYRRRIYWDHKRRRLMTYDCEPPTVLCILASERCASLIRQDHQDCADWHVHNSLSYIDKLSWDSDMRGTALQIALDRGFFDIAEQLLQLGASAQIAMTSRHEYQPPLHVVVAKDRGPSGVKTVKALLEYGADVNARDLDGRTALHLAVGIGRGNVEVVKTLLEHGANLDARDVEGNTMLHAAIASHSAEVVRLILKRGVCVDARNRNGRTPLHVTAGLWDKTTDEVAELLLQHGADVDACDAYQDTPLRLAVSAGNIDIASTLLTHGANQHSQGDTLTGLTRKHRSDMRKRFGRLEEKITMEDLALNSRAIDWPEKRRMLQLLARFATDSPEAAFEETCVLEVNEYWRHLSGTFFGSTYGTRTRV